MFVYGTLKKGKHLHHAYKFDQSKFLGEDSVKGELYTLGWYPALFEEGEHIDDVPGEVYEVEQDVYNTVKDMEEAAGYETKEVKTSKGDKVSVFFHTDNRYRIERNRIKVF